MAKFLDANGVSTLWSKIKEKVNEVDTRDRVTALEAEVDDLQANTYDDTEVRGLIQANTDALAILNGTEDGSVEKTVATKIAEVVAGADADFDTLKEIADWIMNDTTGATSMANDIAALKAKLEGVDTTVVEEIAEAITTALQDENGADKYALATELTALVTRVEALETESGLHSDAITALEALIDADKAAAWTAAEANAKAYTDEQIATNIIAMTDAEIDAAIAAAVV